MKFLFILNDAPYGSERSFNALRLANSLAKAKVDVLVFLLGDAASCAVRDQVTPEGYYNIERMLKILLSRGGRAGVCGSCMDGRGIKEEALVEGAHRSSMDELTAWAMEASQVLVF